MDYRPGDLRPTGRGQAVEVVAPDYCANGHPLGPGQTSVGYIPCDCGKGGTRGHLTWRCARCTDLTIGNGCTAGR